MEALVQAEESGVTQANVESMRVGVARGASKAKGGDPVLWFLLGGSHQIGSVLGACGRLGCAGDQGRRETTVRCMSAIWGAGRR